MTTFVNNDVASGATIFASDHNTQGALIAGVLNGGIEAANLSSSAVTTAKIADDAVTTAKIAQSNVTYDEAAAGFAVQMVSVNTTAQATGTTTIPRDNTIPQNTEGDQYMTLAITPKATTHKLVIEVTIVLSNSAAGSLIAALFQDSTANALAVGMAFQATATGPDTIHFKHTMTAGTTSATTFKIRAGANVAGTTTFNGGGGIGADLFGATTKSSIVITEYKA